MDPINHHREKRSPSRFAWMATIHPIATATARPHHPQLQIRVKPMPMIRAHSDADSWSTPHLMDHVMIGSEGDACLTFDSPVRDAKGWVATYRVEIRAPGL